MLFDTKGDGKMPVRNNANICDALLCVVASFLHQRLIISNHGIKNRSETEQFFFSSSFMKKLTVVQKTQTFLCQNT